MSHVSDRLAERKININEGALEKLASKFKNTSAAILIAKLSEHKGDTNVDYFSRKESNGDLVVFIVRFGIGKTIMYRRSDQPFTPEALGVDQVFDIS